MNWLPAPGVLLLSVSVPAQQILTVGTGMQFATINAAVAAAQAGDRILVSAGTYPGDVLSGKGVRITCAGVRQVTIQGTLRVTGLPAGQTLTLSGATVIGQAHTWPSPRCSDSAIEVLDSPGVVSVEDCELSHVRGPGAYAQGTDYLFCSDPTVHARNATLTLTRARLATVPDGESVFLENSIAMLCDCQFRGGSSSIRIGFHEQFDPFPAVVANGGLLSVHGTTIYGAWGTSTYSTGEAGIQAWGAEIHVTRSAVIVGGQGATGFTGGAGGPGVWHDNQLFVDGSPIRGGAGGPGFQNGPPGPAVSGPAPVPAAIPGVSSSTATPPGGLVQLDALFTPGAYVYWLVNNEAYPLAIPGLRSVLLPAPDLGLIILGPSLLDPSGHALLNFAVPNDPALRGLALFAQVGGVDLAQLPLVFLSAAAQATITF